MERKLRCTSEIDQRVAGDRVLKEQMREGRLLHVRHQLQCPQAVRQLLLWQVLEVEMVASDAVLEGLYMLLPGLDTEMLKHLRELLQIGGLLLPDGKLNQPLFPASTGVPCVFRSQGHDTSPAAAGGLRHVLKKLLVPPLANGMFFSEEGFCRHQLNVVYLLRHFVLLKGAGLADVDRQFVLFALESGRCADHVVQTVRIGIRNGIHPVSDELLRLMERLLVLSNSAQVKRRVLRLHMKLDSVSTRRLPHLLAGDVAMHVPRDLRRGVVFKVPSVQSKFVEEVFHFTVEVRKSPDALLQNQSQHFVHQVSFVTLDALLPELALHLEINALEVILHLFMAAPQRVVDWQAPKAVPSEGAPRFLYEELNDGKVPVGSRQV
mmetsp:Transcript_71625/g.120007  ORF Transcript_71625/g.120007 Transcript_71625/m.120007 type:complete len:378 (-) Transcript_71625:332-1465(-)